jgi:2-phospho-L-lactate guanylyltransferase
VSTYAIIPVNRLEAAKSRLRDTLAAADREALVLWMAARVVRAVQSSGTVARVAVVTPDPAVLAWAADVGAVPLRQDERVGRGLNAALAQGQAWAVAGGAETLLVLLADLPRLCASEVAELVALAQREPPAVVLAPDQRRQGTNALALRPPELLPFAFGAASLARHIALARERGLEPRIYVAPGTTFDVDTSADLRQLPEADWRLAGQRLPAWAGHEEEPR